MSYIVTQILCGDRGGCDMVGPEAATRRASARMRAVTLLDKACDTVEWGHDTMLCARPGRSVRGLGAVRAAWVQGVHTMHSTQF